MTKHRDLDYGDRLPESWVKQIQEFIATDCSANFALTLPSTTTLRVAAGAGNDQVSIGINGKWRFNTSNADAAHPGGAANNYDVYVTASANDFSGGEPETDDTDYSFGLVIRPTASPPATDHYRKIATLFWTGSVIAQVTPLIAISMPGTADPYPVFSFIGQPGISPKYAREDHAHGATLGPTAKVPIFGGSMSIPPLPTYTRVNQALTASMEYNLATPSPATYMSVSGNGLAVAIPGVYLVTASIAWSGIGGTMRHIGISSYVGASGTDRGQEEYAPVGTAAKKTFSVQVYVPSFAIFYAIVGHDDSGSLTLTKCDLSATKL